MNSTYDPPPVGSLWKIYYHGRNNHVAGTLGDERAWEMGTASYTSDGEDAVVFVLKTTKALSSHAYASSVVVCLIDGVVVTFAEDWWTIDADPEWQARRMFGAVRLA
jgi:hypothetical protein